MKDGLLGEYDHEVATTRALIERVPEADAEWKPHPKSTNLGGLATHVVNLLNWYAAILTTPELDLHAQLPFDAVKFTTRDELVKYLDKLAAKTRATIDATTDEAFGVTWTLRNGADTIFSLPRMAAVRMFVMNHLVHHRGQLSVYMRMRDVPLPAMYGPSADS